RGKEENEDQEACEPDRSPELALPGFVNLANDWIVAHVLLDRVLERFHGFLVARPQQAAPPFISRSSDRPGHSFGDSELRAASARISLQFLARRYDRFLRQHLAQHVASLQCAKRVLDDAILERMKRNHDEPR